METEPFVVVGGGLWGEDALRAHDCSSRCTKVTTFIIPVCLFMFAEIQIFENPMGQPSPQ